jgi:cytosol alanyl aminopeptidase
MSRRLTLRFSFGGGSGVAIASAALLAGCLASNDITRAPPASLPASAAEATAPPPLPSGKLPLTAQPVRYAIALAIDPAEDRFTGDVTITVDVPAATPAIVLHARDLTVLRAEVGEGSARLPAKASTRSAAGGASASSAVSASVADEELVLSFPRALRAGRSELHIAYSGALNEKLPGLRRLKREGASYAITQIDQADARRVFPCFDEPAWKAPIELKVTAPKGSLVVANGAETERLDADDGHRTTFRFAETPPLSPHLFALAVGPFAVHEAKQPADRVKLRLVTMPGSGASEGAALDAAATHLLALAEYFDRPYPYAKLDLIALPDVGLASTESAGFVTLREGLLLTGAGSRAEGPRALSTSIAHDLVHQWIGGLVTHSSWDDVWLGEGFAAFLAGKIVDAARPGLDARLAARIERGATMTEDALGTARALRRKASFPSDQDDDAGGASYAKTAAVLGMLEAWISGDRFRSGVRAYVKAHEHGTASASDLFQALSAAADKDVWKVAATFLDQPGLPLVRAELTCDKKGPARVKLTQERYQLRRGAGASGAWQIPVCVAYEGDAGADPACALLDGPTREITLPAAARCPRFIHPNAHEDGYFRFTLPPPQMAALTAASRSLDASARVGLLDDAWALVQSGDMGADALLDLLSEQRRERHGAVLDQVIAVLDGVSATLVDDAARPAFRRYVAGILLPAAQKLGWEAKQGEADDLRRQRQRVLDAIARLGDDPWFTAEAERRSVAYLRGSPADDAEINAIALLASSRHGGKKRFVELLERAERKDGSSDERRLAARALGSFADPPLLRRALDLLLTGEIGGADGIALVDAASLFAESRPLLFAWVKEHVRELQIKSPDLVPARAALLVGATCDEKTRDEAVRLLGDAIQRAPFGERLLQQQLDAAALCIEVRGREGARVKLRLEGRRALPVR